MSATLLNFPYSVSRRAHSRRQRRSKNGTPEERAALGTDPIFGLIEAHREATARHSAALREQERLEQAGVPEASKVADEPHHADMRTWRALIGAAPLTLAGLQAWASYLDEVGDVEGWMLEDEALPIVRTLAQALETLARQNAS